MAVKYLWDTNTVIYYFNKHFPPAGEKFIDDLLLSCKPSISVVTEIELLCWPVASEMDLIILSEFIKDADVYKLDEAVKIKTIEIRKRFRLKLPDAIIAATAITNQCDLISRNSSDFSRIPFMALLDPFKI